MLSQTIQDAMNEQITKMNCCETLKMIGDNRQALLMLDRELGGRQAPQAGQEAQE